MNHETYSAKRIQLIEREEFLAVADKVGRLLNPKFTEERKLGLARKLPDLVSCKREEKVSFMRLREVKFKLEDRLVRKAIQQLKVGALHLLEKDPATIIDRLEIVIPLQLRSLKKTETPFVGEALGGFRYTLLLEGKPVFLPVLGSQCPVTLLLL